MNSNLTQSKQLAIALCAAFPEAFPRNARQALAVGIRDQIAQEFPAIPTAVLNVFLRYWTRRFSYRKALVEPGAVRVNLDGSVQGVVSERDAEFAKFELAEAVKRRQQAAHAHATA